LTDRIVDVGGHDGHMIKVHSTNYPRQEVSPLRPTVQQGYGEIGPVDGQHQAGHASTGAQVNH
jgi:hypothetical protein